ncbi:MAG TPA: hypothetical protein VFB72_04690 [Verrucomicrobiae bacterium]|nr:hypothetical protein [Verrucomicrobiae bacterium]
MAENLLAAFDGTPPDSEVIDGDTFSPTAPASVANPTLAAAFSNVAPASEANPPLAAPFNAGPPAQANVLLGTAWPTGPAAEPQNETNIPLGAAFNTAPPDSESNAD